MLKGAAALGALTSDTQNGGGSSKEITSFKSGTTLKVRVKGTEDLMQYFNYGIFKKVNSFVPKNPADRNAKGFITGNPSPWDKAAQYYFDKVRSASSKDEEEKLKAEGRKYKGKEKFLMGFYDLTSGKDIVVDLTKAQALAVYETIMEYTEKDDKGNVIPDADHEFYSLAFKLSKQGESTSTTVSVTPIINVKKGLTDEEQSNFEASNGQPFDQSMFDGILFEADENEQVANLVTAGFDVSLIGYSNDTGSDDEEVTPITDDPTDQF